MVALGLHCCRQALSSCREQGLLLSVVRGLLAMAAPPVAELRLLLLGSMWDLPRPGVKPMSSASAGRSLPTVPPGKSSHQTWIHIKSHLSYLFKCTFTHPNPEESDSVGLGYTCSMNHTGKDVGTHYCI